MDSKPQISNEMECDENFETEISVVDDSAQILDDPPENLASQVSDSQNTETLEQDQTCSMALEETAISNTVKQIKQKKKPKQMLFNIDISKQEKKLSHNDETNYQFNELEDSIIIRDKSTIIQGGDRETEMKLVAQKIVSDVLSKVPENLISQSSLENLDSAKQQTDLSKLESSSETFEYQRSIDQKTVNELTTKQASFSECVQVDQGQILNVLELEKTLHCLSKSSPHDLSEKIELSVAEITHTSPGDDSIDVLHIEKVRSNEVSRYEDPQILVDKEREVKLIAQEIVSDVLNKIPEVFCKISGTDEESLVQDSLLTFPINISPELSASGNSVENALVSIGKDAGFSVSNDTSIPNNIMKITAPQEKTIPESVLSEMSVKDKDLQKEVKQTMGNESEVTSNDKIVKDSRKCKTAHMLPELSSQMLALQDVSTRNEIVSVAQNIVCGVLEKIPEHIREAANAQNVISSNLIVIQENNSTENEVVTLQDDSVKQKIETNVLEPFIFEKVIVTSKDSLCIDESKEEAFSEEKDILEVEFNEELKPEIHKKSIPDSGYALLDDSSSDTLSNASKHIAQNILVVNEELTESLTPGVKTSIKMFANKSAVSLHRHSSDNVGLQKDILYLSNKDIFKESPPDIEESFSLEPKSVTHNIETAERSIVSQILNESESGSSTLPLKIEEVDYEIKDSYPAQLQIADKKVDCNTDKAIEIEKRLVKPQFVNEPENDLSTLPIKTVEVDYETQDTIKLYPTETQKRDHEEVDFHSFVKDVDLSLDSGESQISYLAPLSRRSDEISPLGNQNLDISGTTTKSQMMIDITIHSNDTSENQSRMPIYEEKTLEECSPSIQEVTSGTSDVFQFNNQKQTDTVNQLQDVCDSNLKLEDSILKTVSSVRNAGESEIVSSITNIGTEFSSATEALESWETMMDRNMNELLNMSKNIVSLQELMNMPISGKVSTSTLENHLAFLQEMETKLLVFKFILQEMVKLSDCQDKSVCLTVEEKFKILRKETELQVNMTYETLRVKLEEVKELLLKSTHEESDEQIMHSSGKEIETYQPHHLSNMISHQEDLLMLIQKYFKIYHSFNHTPGEENSIPFNPDAACLNQMFCKNKLRNLPSNQDIYNSETRLQDYYVSSLPISYFIPNVQFENIIFEQKIEDILDGLHRFTEDPEKLEDMNNVEYYYLQVLQVIYQWIEYIEHWIMKISTLTIDQNAEQCKLVQGELDAVRKHLIKLNEFTQTISPALSEQVKRNICSLLTSLQEQIESTGKLSNSSLEHFSLLAQENLLIDNKLKKIISSIKSSVAEIEKLESRNEYTVPEIKLFQTEVEENSTKYEDLISEKLTLSMKWPGCTVEQADEVLELIHDAKIKVFEINERVLNFERSKNDYNFAFDTLKKLCDVLESFFQLSLGISDTNELTNTCIALKKSLILFEILAFRFNEVLLQCSSNLPSEIMENSNVLVSRANRLYNYGLDRLKMWRVCLMYVNELEKLYDHSFMWLKEKYENAKDHPCPKKDLPDYIAFFKDLQLNIKDHSHQVKRITDLRSKINTLANISSLDDVIEDFLLQYEEFRENIDAKVFNISLFSNQWSQFEIDLKALQKWLSTTQTRLKYLQLHLKNDDLSTVFENMRSISRLHSERDCNEELYEKVRNAVQQAVSLSIFTNESGLSILKEIDEEWSGLTQNIAVIKNKLISHVNSKNSTDGTKELNQWITDIQNSYDTNVISTVCTTSDLHQLRQELQCWLKDISVMEEICSSSTTQEVEGGIFLREQLEVLKFKLMLHLEKVHFFINKSMEFEEVSSHLLHIYETMQSYLEKIHESNLNKNHYALLNNLDDIEKYKTELDENEERFAAVKNLVLVLSEKSSTEEIKCNVISKYKTLEQYNSSLHLFISKTEETAKNNMKIWQKYHEYLDRCYRYVIEQENAIALYDGCILNLQHLKKNTEKLQNAYHEFMENRKLLEDVLDSSILVKKNADAGIQVELDSDVDTLQTRWNCLKNNYTHLISSRNILITEWLTYSDNFQSLLKWIENVQKSLVAMHSNKKSYSKELEEYLQELSSRTSVLLSLKDDGQKLSSNSNLHHLAAKNIKVSFDSACLSLESLKKALMFYSGAISTYCENQQNREKQIENIHSALNDIDVDFQDFVPSNKEELENSLLYTEKLLNDLSLHYTYLLCMRDKLLAQRIIDFTEVHKFHSTLSRIQETTSKLTSYYLKLIKISAESNTFYENCILLTQFLKKFKDLHATEIQCDFWDLLSYFIKSQIMEIYVHSHQIITHQIINSNDFSSASGRSGIQNIVNAFSELLKHWDTSELAYRNKMTFIMERLALWQQYWHQFYKVESSFQLNKRKIAERMILSHSYDPEEELNLILEYQNNLNDDLKAVDLAKKAAGDLLEVLKDSTIEGNVQNQISELRCQIEIEIQALASREIELNKSKLSVGNLMCVLETKEEKLSSVQVFVAQSIPSSLEETKTELEKASVMQASNKSTVDTLQAINVDSPKCGDIHIQNELEQKIETHKNIGLMLCCGLNHRILLLKKNLNKFAVFDKRYMLLTKWCEKIEKRIKGENDNLLLNNLPKLNKIQVEIDFMKPELNNLESLGNILSENEEFCDDVSEKITSMKSTFKRLEDLLAQRLRTFGRITECMNSLTQISEKLNEILEVTEYSPDLFCDIQKISSEDAEKKLHSIMKLEKEMGMYDDSVTKLQNILKEVESCVEYPDSVSLKDAILYSQSVLNRWNALKAILLKHKLRFKNSKCQWSEFFKALERLENWLKSKEDIASEVNYCDLGYSRKDYLEGLGKFEKLNHCFQDDIHILHSVNSNFHDISKTDITVDSTVKERVLAANDHWHKLYNRVAEVFGTLKNILQTWDNFDHLKEHLLLFLTETDVKMTEMETSSLFQKSSFKNIEEEFNFHEDKKERYLATAKHLMQQSESSVDIIQASVDEVLSYWEELYNRLHLLKKTNVHALEKTEISLQYSENNAQMNNGISIDENNETLKETVDIDDIDSSRLKPEQMHEKSTCLTEENQLEIGSKTYSEVVALGSKKLDESNAQSENILPSVWEAASDIKVEKKVKIPVEKQTVTAPKKQKSFDDECIKDLLAALNEAEGRIDSLEKVLSELTPTGIDEQGPNYSRLLAACRSSVDVIQHLSQFLFDDVPHESNKPEIKQQSEDLLHRWQRIELLALNKESRVIENRKNWEKFSKDLKNFETWLQKAFDDCSSESCSDSDVEKLLVLLQRHKELISQIRAQKKIILTLNLTSQKFLSNSTDSSKTACLEGRIKTINDHWDSLCAVAVQWQNKLQTEFLFNSEFKNTLDEMKLWLRESERKIDEMCKIKQRNDEVLHEQHTELYALKQQLEICCNRLETLLEITLHLFLTECNLAEDPNMPVASLKELQTELKSNLQISRSLLIKCTELLKGISSLLGFSKFQDLSEAQNRATSASGTDGDMTDSSQCCSFFMRVARASFPIQAILLLLLGAAILLPMEEEEELSCRLSNNFAASLNPMLRYPDGPPPV